MKKICLIILTALVAFNLTACGTDKGRQDSESDSNFKDNASNSTGDLSEGTNDENATIHISIDKSNRFLEVAVKEFEELHPGIKVEIKEYITPGEIIRVDADTLVGKVSNGNPDESKEKYINNINTELMSGQGADIVSVRMLPYKKYISRNMFADIGNLMKSDKDYEAAKYYTNIFEAVQFNNGLYTIPLDYTYQLLGGNVELNIDDSKWNWNDFFSAAQKNLSGVSSETRKKYILSDTDEDIFNLIFEKSYTRFVNEEEKKSSFMSDEFINLLTLCKNLSDKKHVRQSSTKISKDDLGQSAFYIYDISSLSSLASIEASEPVKNLLKLPSDVKSGDTAFSSSMMLAVNNASKSKNAAWKFIKFLLSDEMQSSPALPGFPVNKDAYKQRIISETKQFSQNDSISLSKDKKTELMNKYAVFADSVAQDINSYPYADPQILKIVKEEVKAFFSGYASAQDVAQAIQNKIVIYLKE